MTDQPPPPPPPPSTTPPPPPGATPGVPATGPLGTPRSKALVILLSVVTFGIWTIVWSYQNGEELKRHRGTGLGGVVYLLLMLLLGPIGTIITMFLLANEVEQMYRDAGREPAITTLWGLWFLLPLIGNIIWYVRIQNAINDYWKSLGSTQKPGL